MVKHWTTAIPGDLNYRNKHAQVEGSDIEFVELPFQTYYGKKGDYSATVASYTKSVNVRVAEIVNRHYTGKSSSIQVKTFDTLDEAFEWADKFINDRNRLFGSLDQKEN